MIHNHSASTKNLLFSLLVLSLAVPGCLNPPFRFVNERVRLKYEKSFANRDLDLIEGFWSTETPWTDEIGVCYAVDPQDNGGFPFACQTVEAHVKVPSTLSPDYPPFRAVHARLKPTSRPGEYRGQAKVARGNSLYWEDATARIVDLTTSESTIYVDPPLPGGNTRLSHYVGPASELERRLRLMRESRKENPARRGASAGTGFLVSHDLAITNFHVIENATGIQCFLSNKPHTAIVLQVDPQNDLALLLLADPANQNQAFLRLGEASRTRQGAKVYGFGFPLTSALGDNLKVTEGIIASLSGGGGSTSEFQLDMNVHPGNSGGPVLDRFGNVIAVVSSKLSHEYAEKVFDDIPSGISFAKKVDIIQLLLNAAGRTDEVRIQHQDEQEFTLEQMTEHVGVAVFRIEVSR